MLLSVDSPVVVGIDPDVNTTAWAVLGAEQGDIRDCGIITSSGKKGVKGPEQVVRMTQELADRLPGILDGRDCPVVIESQHYSDKGSKVLVQNILNLALIAGASAGIAAMMSGLQVHFAPPGVWTKGWGKEVRHNRLREFTYEMTDAQLAKRFGFRPTDAVHVWDAIGIALWWGTEIN